jgi:spore coat polysaccharide biosynthesis predicted glycosyltransferase SpsG
MNNSQIQIYCDGGSKTGFGHISRSKALSNYLSSKGLNSFIIGITKEANGLIGDDAYENKDAQIIVLDSHRNLDKLIIRERKKNKIIITLDWFGYEKPDYNIVIYPHTKPRSTIKNFIGFKYIIIRDEIQLLKNTKKIKNKALICVGGGDLLNQSQLAAEYLNQKGFDVTLVVGPIYKKLLETKNYKVLINPKNFAELLASSSLVVTNGGGCMFESIFLNIPTCVLPQTEFEKNVSDLALKSNAILGSGINFIKTLKIREINFNYQQDLIDGLGKYRIFKIIDNILK